MEVSRYDYWELRTERFSVVIDPIDAEKYVVHVRDSKYHSLCISPENLDELIELLNAVKEIKNDRG
jgi:hypothetical protein